MWNHLEGIVRLKAHYQIYLPYMFLSQGMWNMKHWIPKVKNGNIFKDACFIFDIT
jgi:hypothetical protein